MQNPLTLYYGSMGSGKSSKMVESVTDSTIILVPDLVLNTFDPHRKSDYVRLHDAPPYSNHVHAFDVNNPETILTIVAREAKKRDINDARIDEVQFLPLQFINTLQKLKNQAAWISLGGLLLDTELQHFPTTRDLFDIVDAHVLLRGTCDYLNCKIPSRYIYAKFQKKEKVRVGGMDLYGSSCPTHLNKFRRRYNNSRLPDDLVHRMKHPLKHINDQVDLILERGKTEITEEGIETSFIGVVGSHVVQFERLTRLGEVVWRQVFYDLKEIYRFDEGRVDVYSSGMTEKAIALAKARQECKW